MNHSPQAIPATAQDANGRTFQGFQAVYSCGWKGRFTGFEVRAEYDARMHRHDTTLFPEAWNRKGIPKSSANR